MAADDTGARLRIGLVGYGEVGKILAAALLERANEGGVAWVGTYDILLGDAGAAPAMRAHAAAAGIRACSSTAELLATANVVISAVTASQTLAAAEAARSIRPGTWFVDLNSASPGTKTPASRRVDGAAETPEKAAGASAAASHDPARA